MSSTDDQHQRLEQMASAVEGLLYMGIIALDEKSDSEGQGKALLSPQFSLIVSNVMTNMKIDMETSEENEVMKMMYYSILIHMNENLKLPKPLTVAFGTDLENNGEIMESRKLIATYAAILAQIWIDSHNKK